MVTEQEKSSSSQSEVTNRVVFGLITWFAGQGKSSREYIYIYKSLSDDRHKA